MGSRLGNEDIGYGVGFLDGLEPLCHLDVGEVVFIEFLGIIQPCIDGGGVDLPLGQMFGIEKALLWCHEHEKFLVVVVEHTSQFPH